MDVICNLPLQVFNTEIMQIKSLWRSMSYHLMEICLQVHKDLFSFSSRIQLTVYCSIVFPEKTGRIH